MKLYECIVAAYIFLVETSCSCIPPIIAPRSEMIQTRACRLQSDAYFTSFMNSTRWAVQMYDSSAKFPTGVLAANVYEMGHFDECLRVNVNLGSNNGGEVNGKYCLVTVQIGDGVPHSTPRNSLQPDPFESAWDTIRPTGEVWIWDRNQIFMGICIPAVCTQEDIQNELNHVINNNFFDYNISATVNTSLCQTRTSIEESLQYSHLDYLARYLFMILLFLIVTSSFYDRRLSSKPTGKANTGILMKLLLCFSLFKNVPNVLESNQNGSGFDSLGGLRTFCCILVIYGHRWRMRAIAPLYESLPFEMKVKKFTFMPVATIVMNSFYVFSSFFTGYYFYAELEKREKSGKLKFLIIFKAILFRFLRLTPAYAVVILLNVTLLPKLSDGPLWPKTVLKEVENCKETWWTNLLYINNYCLSRKMCIYHSWYLATEMQLFIMSVIIIYIYKVNRTSGKLLLGSAIVISIIWRAFHLYFDNASPYLINDYRRLSRIPDDDYYETHYIPVQYRIATYFTSLYWGLKTWEWKDSPSKISKGMAEVYSLFAFASCFIVLSIGQTFKLPSSSNDDDTLSRIIFGTLNGPIWAFICGLMSMLLIRYPGSLLHKIFSLYPFMLMNKLSYGAYLLHPIIHYVEFGSLRFPIMPFKYYEFSMMGADICANFFFSFLLSIFIEIPFSRMQKLIFLGGKKEESGETGEVKVKENGEAEVKEKDE